MPDKNLKFFSPEHNLPKPNERFTYQQKSYFSSSVDSSINKYIIYSEIDYMRS